MRNLLQFENLSAYNAAKTGGLLGNPCVSLIKDTMSCNFDPYVEPYDPAKDMVDLGLSFLIAKGNIGATNGDTKKSWYGDYYAWGELSPKESYSWDNYKFGTQDNLTKYNFTDGLTTLQPEDDIVTVKYGSDYRMPTIAEIQELEDETDIEWVDNYNGIPGLSGRKFMNKLDNSIHIFIPVTRESPQRDMTLWSSSVDQNELSKASMLNFTYMMIRINAWYRYSGYSVRAIQPKS